MKDAISKAIEEQERREAVKEFDGLEGPPPAWLTGQELEAWTEAKRNLLDSYGMDDDILRAHGFEGSRRERIRAWIEDKEDAPKSDLLRDHVDILRKVFRRWKGEKESRSLSNLTQAGPQAAGERSTADGLARMEEVRKAIKALRSETMSLNWNGGQITDELLKRPQFFPSGSNPYPSRDGLYRKVLIVLGE